MIQYAWKEDVPLKGHDDGPLDGEYVSLLCGGTLVLDGRGNVLSWMRKPGTGGLDSASRLAYRANDQAIGISRREKLLCYVAERVSNGLIGLMVIPDETKIAVSTEWGEHGVQNPVPCPDLMKELGKLESNKSRYIHDRDKSLREVDQPQRTNLEPPIHGKVARYIQIELPPKCSCFVP